MTQPTITPATPATPTAATPRNRFGVTALVLGIVGAVFCWVPVFGGILAILALVFGALGYSRARKGEANNSGMAIAGLILGAITFIIQVIMFAAVATNQVSKDTDATDQKLAQLTPATTAAPAPPAPATPAPPAPAGPATSFGDGTFVVGTDIAAGTYKASPSKKCYWARLSSTENELDILANHYATGPTTVTIKTSDAAFVSQRCGQWTKVR
jgi:hypothetical protein